MIPARISELKNAENFRKANRPVLWGVIAIVGPAGRIARAGSKTILCAGFTMVTLGIIQLDHSQKF